MDVDAPVERLLGDQAEARAQDDLRCLGRAEAKLSALVPLGGQRQQVGSDTGEVPLDLLAELWIARHLRPGVYRQSRSRGEVRVWIILVQAGQGGDQGVADSRRVRLLA